MDILNSIANITMEKTEQPEGHEEPSAPPPDGSEKKRDAKLVQKEEETKQLNAFFPGHAKAYKKPQIIKEGDKVLLVENSGKMSLIKVKKGNENSQLLSYPGCRQINTETRTFSWLGTKSSGARMERS